MRLYDTLTREVKELWFPDHTVKMYVCGVTPYDTSHLGHARVAVVYDTLRRYLEWSGLRVRYIQNVTDIDEPLFERANRDGVHWRDLGDQQTSHYLAALARINVPRPELYIKATGEIEEMIPRIARLVELDHAYAREGAVYFSTRSDPTFGALSHLDYPGMLAAANEMGNKPEDPKKKDPLDFVLWQPSAEGEPSWPSPWGPGRPGWHIECSTMATHYLGPQVDIHGGGADLIFPHHACEIAQAEPVTSVVPFVRAWMHVGLVSMGGTKMSKSLGNMVFVDDILRTHSANALRLGILSQPYRAPYEYSPAEFERGEEIATAIGEALRTSGGNGEVFEPDQPGETFKRALDEDFNTPEAIAILSQFAGVIRSAAAAGCNTKSGCATLQHLAGVLGLVYESTGNS